MNRLEKISPSRTLNIIQKFKNIIQNLTNLLVCPCRALCRKRAWKPSEYIFCNPAQALILFLKKGYKKITFTCRGWFADCFCLALTALPRFLSSKTVPKVPRAKTPSCLPKLAPKFWNCFVNGMACWFAALFSITFFERKMSSALFNQAKLFCETYKNLFFSRVLYHEVLWCMNPHFQAYFHFSHKGTKLSPIQDPCIGAENNLPARQAKSLLKRQSS